MHSEIDCADIILNGKVAVLGFTTPQIEIWEKNISLRKFIFKRKKITF